MPCCHALVEIEDGGLGSRIVDQLFARIVGIHRDGIDDAVTRRQMRDGCLAKTEHLIEVVIEGAIELLISDFEDVGLALLVSEVVRQEI